jgi:hypothetical protein
MGVIQNVRRLTRDQNGIQRESRTSGKVQHQRGIQLGNVKQDGPQRGGVLFSGLERINSPQGKMSHRPIDRKATRFSDRTDNAVFRNQAVLENAEGRCRTAQTDFRLRHSVAGRQ